MKDYLIVVVNIIEPITTIESLFNPSWEHVMQHDMDSISNNDIWTLEELPLGKWPITSKWVYKTKVNVQGEVENFKVWIVARGFGQTHDLDYFETFAPILRWEKAKLVVAS